MILYLFAYDFSKAQLVFPYDYFSKSPLKMSFIELLKILAVAAVITCYHSAASETTVRFFLIEITIDKLTNYCTNYLYFNWQQSEAIFEIKSKSNRSSISQSKFASSIYINWCTVGLQLLELSKCLFQNDVIRHYTSIRPRYGAMLRWIGLSESQFFLV